MDIFYSCVVVGYVNHISVLMSFFLIIYAALPIFILYIFIFDFLANSKPNAMINGTSYTLVAGHLMRTKQVGTLVYRVGSWHWTLAFQ